MKFTYLGTAAAEGWPSLFCECAACKRAKELGGKNLRTRSQAVVDGKLLLDFGPDTFYHALFGKLDINAVENVLVTHSHEDHFLPDELMLRSEGFARYDKSRVVTLYGNSGVMAQGEAEIRRFPVDKGKAGFELREVFPFKTIDVGGYAVTPLLADHSVRSTNEKPLIYLIENGGKSVLYAHDTGYFKDETWAALKGKRLDFASLDCTNLFSDWRTHHMCFAACAEVKERLISEGIADERTVFFVNHFSHNGGGAMPHDEFEREAAKYGIGVSYDGLTVEV